MRKVQKKYCGYNVVVLGNRLKFSEIFFYEEVRCLSSSFEFGQACDCFDLEIIEEMMLCDYIAIKIPKLHGLVSFWAGGHTEVPGEVMGAPPPPPHLALSISSIWLFLNSILHNKLVNTNVSLNPMSHCSKYRIQGGVVRPLMYI